MNASSPIGVFDSGIGGLTVAHAITRYLPSEQLVYFGDTAHLPYGDKSSDSIKYYSIRISQFLLERGCKMIVIACNTASAQAYETVKDFVGDRALVINVIDPVVEQVAGGSFKKVGVIGTKGTIRSDIYAKKIGESNAEMAVASVATPLLAPMIEEGFFNNKISRTVIESYLTKPKLRKIDALILACTHYPLIKDEIEKYYGDQAEIIDSADIVASFVKDEIESNKLKHKGKHKAHEFHVSDFTDSFQKSTRYFFKSQIRLHETNFWK